jgi:hypothetical protein
MIGVAGGIFNIPDEPLLEIYRKVLFGAIFGSSIDPIPSTGNNMM